MFHSLILPKQNLTQISCFSLPPHPTGLIPPNSIRWEEITKLLNIYSLQSSAISRLLRSASQKRTLRQGSWYRAPHGDWCENILEAVRLGTREDVRITFRLISGESNVERWIELAQDCAQGRASVLMASKPWLLLPGRQTGREMDGRTDRQGRWWLGGQG